MRSVAAIAAGTAGAWMALGGGSAQAARAQAAQADKLATADVAAALAAVIRSDAREELHRSRNTVTVTRRCCGVRVLRVRYGSKGARPAARSFFVLRLEVRHGGLQGVAVFLSASEAQYKGGAKASESSSRFTFVIHHERRNWNTLVSYEEISQGPELLSGHPGGLGFARTCLLRSSLPVVLYRSVLRTLERAKRHRAFAPEGLAPGVCIAG
jgi:hypothetical protein